MPRPRFQKLDAERRDAIMEAAAKIFAEEGYYNASINQILQTAGLSKGVAYYYFEDKADLFATTVEFYMKRIEFSIYDRMDDITADNFWEVILELYSEPFLQNLDAPYRFQVLKVATKIPESDPFWQRIAPLINIAFGWTIQLVEKGQKLGLVRTDLPHELLYGYIAAIDEVGDNYILDRLDDITRDEVITMQSQVVDTMKRLLSP